MKQLSIYVFLLLLSLSGYVSFASAQHIEPPVPNWLNNVRDGDKKEYVYSHGIGYGSTNEEADAKAEINGQKGFIYKLVGLEFQEQPTGDSLKAIIQRKNIAWAKGMPYHVRTPDGVITTYILCKATLQDTVKTDNIPFDSTFEKRVAAYYCSLKPIPPKKKLGALPFGIMQLHRERTAFEITRGAFWLVGQTGGLAGGIAYGVKWSRHQNKLVELKEELKKAVYDDEENRILQDINTTEDKISKAKLGFGVSVGVMCLFYGLNVIDNCVWTKTDAQGRKSSLCILPNISPEYNGIGLTYNF